MAKKINEARAQTPKIVDRYAENVPCIKGRTTKVYLITSQRLTDCLHNR